MIMRELRLVVTVAKRYTGVAVWTFGLNSGSGNTADFAGENLTTQKYA